MKSKSKRRTPKRIRIAQTSRHWQVVPRRHTGHLTHRRTTSYPALMMIVLCVGVFLGGWTQYVKADSGSGSYTVQANVHLPAPTVPATIDSPADGTKVIKQPITASGTCPLDTYVTLYRNGAFSGVALCQADGTWELETGLFPGANQLQARVFNQTDTPGPLSNIVTVIYEPKQPPVSNDSGSSGSATTTPSTGTTEPTSRAQGMGSLAEPLIFKTNFTYGGHFIGQASVWQLAIEGGTPPYAIAVDWGDGTRGLISRPRADSFTVEHIYRKPGGYKGSYVVKFSAIDTDGEQAFLQLMTIVNNPPPAAGSARHPGSGTGPDYLSILPQYTWPAYLVLVLMLLSFWLGERREYYQLRPRLKKARHA